MLLVSGVINRISSLVKSDGLRWTSKLANYSPKYFLLDNLSPNLVQSSKTFHKSIQSKLYRVQMQSKMFTQDFVYHFVKLSSSKVYNGHGKVTIFIWRTPVIYLKLLWRIHNYGLACMNHELG